MTGRPRRRNVPPSTRLLQSASGPRARRQPPAARINVLFHGDEVQMELGIRRALVCCGAWKAEVTLDGQVLSPVSDWSEVCWNSDQEADYLELAIRLQGGVRIERQLLLARRDGFVWLADAVLAPRRAKLEYRGTLPLAPATGFRPAAETHEGRLVVGLSSGAQRDGQQGGIGEWGPLGPRLVKPQRNGHPVASANGAMLKKGPPQGRSLLVLPLALPEWRLDPMPGGLMQEGALLAWRQAAVGRALLAPLFVDFHTRRQAQPFTWRRLTVAEQLKPLPADKAVGYRVAIGNRQWLFYRSLARRGNRTLLGHNLITETLIARFRAGTIEPLLEIE